MILANCSDSIEVRRQRGVNRNDEMDRIPVKLMVKVHGEPRAIEVTKFHILRSCLWQFDMICELDAV